MAATCSHLPCKQKWEVVRTEAWGQYTWERILPLTLEHLRQIVSSMLSLSFSLHVEDRAKIQLPAVSWFQGSVVEFFQPLFTQSSAL